MIQTIEQALAAAPLLCGLDPRRRRRLVSRATTHSYPPESVILRQGDTSMAVYVVLSGAARVERELPGGGRVAVGELGPGAMFGEMGVLDDAPRSATIVALERTRCALLAKWDFEEPLREDAGFAVAVARQLSERVRRLEGLSP
jgi:CRP/FNR family transcriptional regulator, cyclic AMP receptor protein